jgi:hypothetical protein
MPVLSDSFFLLPCVVGSVSPVVCISVAVSCAACWEFSVLASHFHIGCFLFSLSEEREHKITHPCPQESCSASRLSFQVAGTTGLGWSRFTAVIQRRLLSSYSHLEFGRLWNCALRPLVASFSFLDFWPEFEIVSGGGVVVSYCLEFFCLFVCFSMNLFSAFSLAYFGC